MFVIIFAVNYNLFVFVCLCVGRIFAEFDILENQSCMEVDQPDIKPNLRAQVRKQQIGNRLNLLSVCCLAIKISKYLQIAAADNWLIITHN